MAHEILTPDSPRWDLFVRLLDQALSDGGCSHNHQYAEAVMAELGGIDIARTLEFFEQHGGYCDCEVLFNVYDRSAPIPTLEEIEQYLEQEKVDELSSPVNLNVPTTLQ